MQTHRKCRGAPKICVEKTTGCGLIVVWPAEPRGIPSQHCSGIGRLNWTALKQARIDLYLSDWAGSQTSDLRSDVGTADSQTWPLCLMKKVKYSKPMYLWSFAVCTTNRDVSKNDVSNIQDSLRAVFKIHFDAATWPQHQVRHPLLPSDVATCLQHPESKKL